MVLGGSCPLISSVCKEPSGSTRIRRVRAASMRTLTCSRSGTSGPGMELFKAGLDSKRTACAKADAPSRSDAAATKNRSEEHTSELQSHSDLVCRLLLEKK